MASIQISEIKVIPYGVHAAEINMATDRYLLGVPGTVLRLYGWAQPTLSFGRLYRGADDIDADYCRKRGINMVKRLSGGKTVLHDRELTYAFISDTELFPDSVVDTYRVISRILVDSFSRFGLGAEMSADKGPKSDSSICFKEASAYELTVNSKKLVGSAQYRKRKRFFQHGSILLGIDWQTWKRIWRLSDDSTDLEERMTSFQDEIGYHPTAGELATAITEEFCNSFGAVSVEFKLDELAEQEVLKLSRKYVWEG